jgi:PAS domain S-box-containing protein
MITLRTGLPCRDVPMNLAHPDGRRIWIIVTTEPLRDRSGAVTGVMASFTDVTEEMATGAELQVIHDRYRSTLQQIRLRDQELQQRTIELETARAVAKLGFWRTDLATGVTVWSPELFAMGGFEPAEGGVVRPEILAVAFPPEVAAERDALVMRGLTTDAAWEQTLRVVRSNGTPRWVLINGMIERNVDGGPVAATGTAMDVTEQTEARLALAASEAALRQRTEELEEARDVAGLGVWRMDRRTGSLTWSPQLLRIFGIAGDAEVPPDEPARRAVFGTENAERLNAAAAESALTGRTVELELAIHRVDGELRWVQQRIRTEPAPDGSPAVVTGTVIDVTDRKLTEIALRDSEEELRQRTEELEEARRIAGIGVWGLDLVEGRPSWSAEMFRIFGMEPAERPPDPETVSQMLGEDIEAELAALALWSARTGQTWEHEQRVLGADGVERWMVHRGVAEVDALGRPIEIHGTAQDITERKQAELALAASEARFRSVLDNLVEGAEMIAPDWTILYINRAFTRTTGTDPSAAIGRNLLEELPGFEQTEIFARFKRCIESRVADRFQAAYAFPGAPEVWWEFSVQPVPEGIFVLALDITARHAAEQVIADRTRRERERMTRLEEAGRMAGLGIWRRDLVLGQTTWSPEMYELFEVDPAQPPMTPDAVDAALTPASRELRRHVSSTAMAAGVPWEVELELVLPSGARKWVLQHGVAETDASGTVIAYRGTALDITERKRTEQDLRRFNEALEQRVSERTAELEAANEELRSFSYTVSHDLRGPVRAVAGFARILERDYGAQLDERALHSLTNIKTAGEAMGHLIDDLLAYTRIGRAAVRREPVPILPIAKRLATTFAQRAEERGGTVEVIEPMATPIGDPTLLEELLINLVDNALNYGRPDVPPRVCIAAICLGDTVKLSVSDNGVGIPEDQRERIFEVFTRLPGTDAEQGTGIGLAIVRKAARSMGSDVTVESEVGAGTAFSVLLPCAEDRPPRS